MGTLVQAGLLYHRKANRREQDAIHRPISTGVVADGVRSSAHKSSCRFRALRCSAHLRIGEDGKEAMRKHVWSLGEPVLNAFESACATHADGIIKRERNREETNKGEEMSKTAEGRGKVLLVESSRSVEMLIEEVLKDEEGYQVRGARGVEEGVQALREEQFGVVVLDVCDLPREEAHRCIEEIVAAAAGTPVGVRVIEEEGVRERGVTFVVGHPFDMNKLLQDVERAMSGQEQP